MKTSSIRPPVFSAGTFNPIYRFVSALMLLCILAGGVNSCLAQTTIFEEDFGTGTSLPTGWSSSSTDWQVNSTVNSSGYTGASGGSNAQFPNTTTTTRSLSYSNYLSTVGYTNITVLWGGRYLAPNSTTIDIVLSWSSNGSTWNTVNFTDVPASSSGAWSLVNGGTRIALPVGAAGIANLRLRFTATASASASPANTSYRFDDVTVMGCPTTAGSISYAGTPFCRSITTNQAVTPSDVPGGTFSSTTGLSIGSTTGSIRPSTSTAGTYTVTYTIPAGGGCVARSTTTTVTITTAPTATISYSGAPFCSSLTAAQAVTRSGTSGGTYSSTTGLTLNASTGAITPSTSTAGTYTVTYTIAASGGCAAYTTTTSVTITTAPAATITYAGNPFCNSITTAQAVTSTGTTGGTYSSTTGLTLNATTGAITPSTSTVGNYTVTYTIAASGGCAAYTTTTAVTIGGAAPSISGTATETCVGGSTGTITATASGGTAPYTYSLNAGAYQSSINFSGLAAGTYTLNVQNSTGCTASTSITVNRFPNSTDDQSATGSDSWIGHMYDGTNFTDYVGHFTETENFNENFNESVSNATCFDIVSNGLTRSIYTETFSVKFRMNSTKKGLYVVDLGADDGNRLTVDGTLIYNYWSDNAFVTYPSVLMSLKGTSSLLYEYYENSGGNRVIFQNLTQALANTLSTNISQSICVGSNGLAISGDVFGTLPSGISLSGTGYQWSYSTTPGGTRTLISGATGATFTPNTTVAPFNTTGTYYVYRNAALSSTNNISYNPYVATHESNAATITVSAAPSATITYAGTPFCKSVTTTQAVTQTGTAGGTYTSTTGLSIDATTGAITPSTSTAGTYTVTYTIAANSGCVAFTTTTSITITATPSATITYAGTPYCTSLATTQAVTRTGTSGGIYSSTTGLTLNATTGDITPSTSTAGTYSVTYRYSASGGCGTFITFTSVTINTAPSASISYTGTPFCKSVATAQAVTQTGTTGGTYSSTTGLSINSTTGAIIPSSSTAGTYTVTYTVAASGGCAAFTTTTSVTITTAPSATISYAGTPFCNSVTAIQVVSQNGTSGGTYSSTTGLSINSTTGDITPSSSTAGTYTVTYTIATSGGCAAFTTNTTITITTVPSATISYAGTPFCSSITTAQSVTQTGTSGGTYSSTTGLSINTSNGAITPSSSTAGTYTVTYTIAATGGCAAYTTTTNITITTQPFANGYYAGTPYCSNGGIVYPSGTAAVGASGTLTSTAGLSINATTGAVNLGASTPGSYIVTYTVPASGGCSVYTNSTPITITQAPSTTISYAGSPYCSNAGIATVTRTGTTGGIFSSTAGLSIDTATGNINPALSTAGTYTVTYTIAASGGCATYFARASIVIKAAPPISQIPASNLIAYYKLEGDASDATGNDNGTLQNNPAPTADRFNNANKAYVFNGSSQYISTTTAYSSPAEFTISIWFKTTSVTGGKLIGFGNAQTGLSSQNDRQIYMANTGRIYFGTYSGSVQTVSSALPYNDGNWHLATTSLSATAGMILYMDGTQVGTNSSVTSAQNYTGYWKLAYGNLNGWTDQPSSYYFNGSLDDALIYQSALTSSQIAALYNAPDGAGNNGPVCVGTALNLTGIAVPGASYAWTGPNGFTSALQNPTLVYNSVNAGVYTLQVTAGGCTSTAYTNVASSTNAGQWTGNISADWSDAGNWCNGVLPTSSINVIIAAGATRMPSIVSPVVCNNLTINTGATVTISSAGTVNIAGTLANYGTYVDNGTTAFNGTSGQQTFSGVTTFNNLTLNNTGGLLLPASIVTKNNLTLSAGVLTTNNFNISIAGNWINNASTTAFTAGTGTVTFNGTTAQTIGGSFSTTFNTLTISNATGTVSLLMNTSLTGNLNVSAGTFDLATFTANRTTSGGILTVANNATLKIGGTNTFPVNYITITLVVASTVEYSGTDQAVANQLYGNLTLSSSGGAAVKTLPSTAMTVVGNLTSRLGVGTSVAFTAAAAITVNGNISIGASTTFNGGSYVHSLGGNWVNAGTFTGNTSTVTFTGTNKMVSGAGAQNFNNLTVAASGIGFSADTIRLTGNLATSGSGSFVQAAGGTLAMSGSSATISGAGISMGNLQVSGSATTSATFTLSGNLAVSGSFVSNAGTITMSGSTKTLSGTGSMSFYILSIPGSTTAVSSFTIRSGLIVDGSLSATAGTATFTGTSTLSGTANLYNTTINGTSLKLSQGAVLGVANVLTITSGTLDVTTSSPNTVNFNGTGAQTINAITYSNLILSNGSTKTAAGAITTANDITIATGTTFNPSSFTHSIYGNWINNGTFTAGSSTITFRGPSNAVIRGNTTFNILTVNVTSAATLITLQSSVSAEILNMVSGTLSTGLNTITITNTRTGNGIILGYIRRTHTFITAVAYAFEGPANTISFSAVSGVNSITVFVSEESIPDFPFGGSISRVYNINIPSGTYNATLRLHYEDNELNGSNESSMALWHYNGSLWGSSGKTANDTTSNYVEQSGLTDITNRWTLSDDGNLVQWNGSVSSDWNTPANWTVLQGSGSRPPSSTDIVDLGTTPFTNQPTITSPVTVKNIVFGSVQAVTLTLSSGGSLTTLGDINGSWTSIIKHTINVNNQTLKANGDIALSDGTSGHAIDLNIGSGTVSTLGSLVESGGANIHFSGAGTLNIFENFTYSSGTFTAGSGTVIYNGNENQALANINYNHLIINKAGGLAEIHDTVNIAGNLLIASGELDNFSNTTIAGNVTIDSAGTFNNHQVLHVQGNWNNNGTFISTDASIFFDGTGSQTISASTFNDLNINKPSGTATLTGDLILTGNLIITSGIFDFKTFFVTRQVLGGATLIADGATGIIGGNNGPANFATKTVGINSTIIYNGTDIQYISSEGLSFGNIIFRNGGSSFKLLITPLSVGGNLTIENGASLNGSAFTISLGGNWINSGTFIPSTSNVILSGTAKTLTGNTTFYRSSITGSYSVLSDIGYNKLLEITSSGSLTSNTRIATTVNGDLINSGVLITNGSATFTGNVLQTISLINPVSNQVQTVNFNGSVSPVLNSTAAVQFNVMNINNTAGIYPTVGWTINDSLNISSGASFYGGASTHNLMGNVFNNGIITSSGTLNFLPSSAVTVNLGSNFSSTGRVVLGGAGAMTLAGTPVSFRSILISNTNSAGITPSSDWKLTNNLTINSGSLLNAGNHLYSIGGNLLNNGTINSGTSTFMLNGTGSQDMYSASAFNNLTINKAGGVTTLSSNATVNGVLNFIAGKIQTGSNSLIQPASGTSTGASQNTGWVNGKLQKNVATGTTVRTFEVGDTTSYTPVSLLFSGVTVAGNLTAFTTGGDHPNISSSSINPNKSVNRFWTLANSGIGFTNYSATYHFVATDVDGGTNTSSFKVGYYNGSSWSLPVVASPTDTSIQATGVTTFGDVAIGEICNAGTTIAYPDSIYCSNAGTTSIVRTGTPGGTYMSVTGLVIDAATGAVNLGASTAGTYVVTYTIAASGSCRPYITTTKITISSAPAATIAYAAPAYCSNAGTASITRTGTAGGTYTSSAGLAIDAVTGAVNLGASTAGNYIVTYTIAASGRCSVYTATTSVTITPMPSAGITYVASPYCSDGGFASITQTGTTGGAYSSTTGLSITSSTGLVNLTASTAGTYTVTYTVATAGGCSQYQTSTSVIIKTAGMWTGTVSTDYSNAQNWLCGSVPLLTANVVIPAGLTNYPIISGSSAATNISIANGASLQVTGTLQVAGTITNNGKFSAMAGTLEFNGTSAQQIVSGLFDSALVKNLTINNSAGVTLSTPLSLTGILNITSGQLNTGDQLTLKSSATATAMVAAITSGATTPINGKVTVERYIPGRRKYRLITSSVTTSPAATLSSGQETLSIWGAWQNSGINTTAKTGTFITGGSSADGFDPQTTNASLFTYDAVNRRYTGFTTTNGKNTKYTPLKAGVSYYMFVYGDRTNTITTSTPNNTVLSETGTLLTGNQVYTTSSTIPLSSVTGRFTLLGNPFASTINWATLPKTNLDDAYWGWDPNLNSTGGYVTVLSSGTVTLQAPYSGSTGLNQYIQPGQGFFVKTSGTSPTLTIREQDKVTNFNSNAFRGTEAAEKLPLLAINLLYQNGSNKVLADGVLAAFSTAYSNRVGSEDGVKLVNSTENIAILNDTNWLSIDARKMPQTGDTLFLNVARLTKPQYTLQIFAEQMATSGLTAYLQDRYLNTVQLLSLTDTNNVAINIVPGVAASSDTNRFRIVFQVANPPLPVTFTAIKATLVNKEVQVDWEIGNEAGIQKYEVERSTDGNYYTKVGETSAKGSSTNASYRWLDAAPLYGNNYYRVRAVQADGKFWMSKTVVATTRKPLSVTIYPNPVMNGRLLIRCEGMEKGEYTVLLLNEKGQQVIRQKLKHGGGLLEHILHLHKAVPAGMYYLELETEQGKYGQLLFVE